MERLVTIFGFIVALTSFLVFMKSTLVFGINNPLSLLAFLSSVCGAGILKRHAWARKGLIVLAFLGILWYGYVGFTYPDGYKVLPVGFFMLWSSMLLFLFLPSIRKLFAHSKKRKRILVIDDEKTLLRLMEVNFQARGFEVLTADTGEEGLAMARSQKPDVILLDVILPGLKGRAVCIKLKSDPVTKDIPVIFLTAKNSADDVMAEQQAGGIAHLTKPVDFKQVYAIVKKVLDL